MFIGDFAKSLCLSIAICVSRVVAVFAFRGTSGLVTFGFYVTIYLFIAELTCGRVGNISLSELTMLPRPLMLPNCE